MVAKVRDVRVALRLGAQRHRDREVVGQDNRRIGGLLLQISQERSADIGNRGIAVRAVSRQIMIASPD